MYKKVRKLNNPLIFASDFETTVYSGQTTTEVWSSALVQLYTEDVHIYSSINDFFSFLSSLNNDVICYFHNLKFDGTFIISYLHEQGFTQGINQFSDNLFNCEMQQLCDLQPNSYTYMISMMGQWYKIDVRIGNYIIEFRDSLKLLPFSLRDIGQSFHTKHQKLEMEYVGFRQANGTITDEEKEYIANDVLVLKEALEIMFNDGNNKLTIGSNCLSQFKKIIGKTKFEDMFPNLSEIPLDIITFGSPDVDAYIRKSYRGGWCYVVDGKEGKIFENGCTADVNSLYPSMMHSQSGNKFPYGKPQFWTGSIPNEWFIDNPNTFYFVRVKCTFEIKENMLPFIQIKNNPLYKRTECLKSSIPHDKDGFYLPVNNDNEYIDPRPIITFTETEYRLFKEHYNLYDVEELDGCWFMATSGIFDEYINKYKEIKINNKGALRQIAKLFLNNLYGKFSTSSNSSWKRILFDEGVIKYALVPEFNKKLLYIPVGSAITSYARNFTIRTAQKNYYGVDKKGFIYADTDSIHCDLPREQLSGLTIHDSDFCCWKIESEWDKAIFTRQKTYIEHIVAEDCIPIDEPYYQIRCAGMNDKAKELLVCSFEQNLPKDYDELNVDELEFIKEKRTLKDFKVGLVVPGKLMPKRIKGGTVLVETTFEMR